MIAIPLDELYLQWLYSQVGNVAIRRPSGRYWNLFRQMYKKEYVWYIANDDNRAADGKQLRYEFVEELQLENVDRNWMELTCSFLEMLIALSRRLAFEAEGEPRDWFWHLLHTLELDIYSDAIQIPYEKVDDILNRVIWRTYRKDGYGGLFPLRRPRQDQTKVEVWYQLNSWLMENDY